MDAFNSITTATSILRAHAIKDAFITYSAFGFVTMRTGGGVDGIPTGKSSRCPSPIWFKIPILRSSGQVYGHHVVQPGSLRRLPGWTFDHDGATLTDFNLLKYAIPKHLCNIRLTSNGTRDHSVGY